VIHSTGHANFRNREIVSLRGKSEPDSRSHLSPHAHLEAIVLARRPTSEFPESLNSLYTDPRFSLANWGRFNLMVCRQEISALGAAIWARAMNQLKQTYPGRRFGQLTWIEAECSLVQDDLAYAACVEGLQRFGDCMAASAVIYAREGFWNATLRGRVTAMHHDSKIEIPYAMHPSLADAAAWLGEHAPDLPALDVPALTRAFEQLRVSP
jgi:hypothetical protein